MSVRMKLREVMTAKAETQDERGSATSKVETHNERGPAMSSGTTGAQAAIAKAGMSKAQPRKSFGSRGHGTNAAEPIAGAEGTAPVAVNDLSVGIDRFGYTAYAQALVELLRAAEPPVCVGLYAKWGSGKSFMIGLLKQFFDPTCRRDTVTHELVQWFE